MTHTEFSRKGGRAGTGKSKARDPEKMRAAGKKGAAIRWTRAALTLIKSGDGIVGSTSKSRTQAERLRKRLVKLKGV